MYRIRKFCQKHPGCVLIGFVLFVILFAALLIILPTWGTYTVLLSLIGLDFIVILQMKNKTKKAEERMQNFGMDDFRQMYSQYVAIIEGEVEEIGDYARAYFCENWLEKFHKYLYCVSSNIRGVYLTDFNIAAAMFFALTPENASKYQVLFAYDCVRNMISTPQTYIRHIRDGNELELDVVEDTFDEVDFSIIENRVSPEEICKIMKEVYISNKNDASLIGLSNFLRSLYEQCHCI